MLKLYLFRFLVDSFYNVLYSVGYNKQDKL